MSAWIVWILSVWFIAGAVIALACWSEVRRRNLEPAMHNKVNAMIFLIGPFLMAFAVVYVMIQKIKGLRK